MAINSFREAESALVQFAQAFSSSRYILDILRKAAECDEIITLADKELAAIKEKSEVAIREAEEARQAADAEIIKANILIAEEKARVEKTKRDANASIVKLDGELVALLVAKQAEAVKQGLVIEAGLSKHQQDVAAATAVLDTQLHTLKESVTAEQARLDEIRRLRAQLQKV